MAPHRSILTVLSIDLLIQILDRVDAPADRKSFRLVSRTFLKAESLHRRAIKILRIESLAPLLSHYSSSLEFLDLASCPSLSDAALGAALALAPRAGQWRLRAVDLSRASGVTWRGLAAMVAACPWLESVDLAHCVGVGDREAAALAGAARLRELRMDKCLELTDVGLARVAVGCVGLEKLGIKWCLEISDLGIELLVKKCSELRVLDLSYLKVSNKSLESVSTLGKLEELHMVGCAYIDDEGLGFLNNGRNSLKVIDFSRCESITSNGLAIVIEGHKSLQKLNVGDCAYELMPNFLNKLKELKNNLTVLKLDGLQVSSSSLQIIGANCENLVEIGLAKCTGMADDGVLELVSNCSGLMSIDLTCCRLISDKSLISIADQCKNLKSLRLESCNLVTEKGLDRVGMCCCNLEELDLTDCCISNSALKSLSGCSKLMVLKLGLCEKISDEGLMYVALNCRKLHELDLYRCTEVTDDGLAAIATGCRKLQSLNLCYCRQITDQGMKHISNLGDLRELELRGLNNVTGLGITAVAMGCRNLRQLDLKRCQSMDDSGLCALAQYTENLNQINLSDSPISGIGLCMLLGSSRCLQDVDLVNLTCVPVQGFEIALRASLGRLKKVKLLNGFKQLLSPSLLEMLHARGCRLRWLKKPTDFVN